MAVRVVGNTVFAGSHTTPQVLDFTIDGSGSPVSGNVILAGFAERSGGRVANHTIADDGSDTGWAELVSHEIDYTDVSDRMSFKVWWKESDGTEDEITLAGGAGSGYGMAFISEYELEGSEEWGSVLGESSDFATSVGTSESLNSDDTASISGNDFLVLPISAVKLGASGYAGLAMDFDDGINDVFDVVEENFTIGIALADLNDSVTGVRSDTANFSCDNGANSFISMIAVFDLTAAAPPGGDVEIFRRRIEGY